MTNILSLPAFKVISVISSPDTETHNDCVSGEIFVKRFANALKIAGLVGRSAPADSTFFYGLLRCCGFTTALAQGTFLANERSFRSVMFGTKRGHYTHKRIVLTSDSNLHFCNRLLVKERCLLLQHNIGP